MEPGAGSIGLIGSASKADNRLPFIVPLLALGTFLMCTTEFLVAGLLPEMASDLAVSLSRVGLLVTAFAVGMMIGAPVMAVATLRFPRRLTLVVALILFSGGHVIVAFSSRYDVVLAARVFTALVTGTFWAVASVVAMTAAGPARASRALGVMMSGVGLATVVGVPAGAWLGQQIGWRGAFGALACVAAIAAIVVARFAPSDPAIEQLSLAYELAALRNARLWLTLVAAGLVLGACIATFSYISPLLTDRAGVAPTSVPIVLVGFGIGSLLGTNVAGRLADRAPLPTLVGAALATGGVLGLLATPLSRHPLSCVVLIVLLGAFGMSVPPVATGLSVGLGGAPAMSAALTVSAFNMCIAGGSWIAGVALDSRLGSVGPTAVGVFMVVLALAPLAVLVRTDTKSSAV